MVAAMVAAALPGRALSTGYFAKSTPLSSGRWVKINVSATGMQEITAEELASMGFDDPAKVAVCGYGGAMLGKQQFDDAIPDAVSPVPSVVANGKLVFYGEAGDRFRPYREPLTAGRGRWRGNVVRNYYSLTGSYFLTDAVAPQAPEMVARADASGAPSVENTTWGFVYNAPMKNRNGNLGANFFGDDLKETGPQTFDNYLPGLRYAGTTISQEYNRGIHLDGVVGIKSLTALMVNWVMPSGNICATKSRVADLVLQNYRDLSFFGMENTAKTPDDIYRLKLYIGDNSNATASQLQYGALEHYTLTYLRSDDFSAPVAQQMVTFTSLTNPAQQLKLRGASATLAVWDVTDPLGPRQLARGAASADADAPDAVTLGRTGLAADGTSPAFLVFDPALTLNKVEYAGEVANTNLHAMNAPEMLIVAAREFMPQAQRLAEIHRELRGTDAVAVCQEDVFNEFSSGTRTHEAIRRFARMLRDRGSRFRSLLVFGYANSDNRGVVLREEGWRDRFVPIYECPHMSISGHHSLSYASDIFYGVLSDEFSIHNAVWPKMDIAVGRLPAQNAEQANDMVDKIEKYLKNPPSTGSTNRALLMADSDGDNNFVNQAEMLAQIVAEEKPSTMLYKAYDDLYPHTNDGATHYQNFVTATLQEGACFMTYFGHGSAGGFGVSGLWNSTLARNTMYPVPPLTVLGTCSPLSIDLSPDCVGSWMFINKNGGSIGVIGAQREVYMNYNFDIVEAVTRKYFSAEPNTTLGEIFRQAVNSNADLQAERNRLKQEEFNAANPGSTIVLAVDTALIINTRSYTFVGDPEIPSYAPTHSARLEAVNGTQVAGNDAIEVLPLRPVAFEGVVTNAAGEVDTDFNGEAIIMVYDSPRNVKDVSNRPKPLDIATNQYPILNVKANVTRGRFATEATLPMPARPGMSNTVSLYAMSENGFEHANGAFNNLRVADTDPNELPEPQPPVISELYIDSPDFVSGQVTGPDFTLRASISDPSGVIGVSSLFGKSLTVSLDDSKNISGAAAWLSTDVAGDATLALPVSGLVDGPHRLTLTARGNAGGEASKSINFTVISTPAKASLSTLETTAVNEATLELEHDFAHTPDCHLVVTDSKGNTVAHNTAATFPYRWDLADKDGNRVADGVYTATAYLHNGLRYATASASIVVLTEN